MARIRKGDLVAVMTGADKGKRGRVLRVMPEQGRVVVEGVRMVFKHLRKTQKNPQGGRIRREAWIAACNVMPIDPSTDKPTKVASALVDGRRERVGRKSRAVMAAAAGQKAGRPGAPQAAPVTAKAAKPQAGDPQAGHKE